MCTVDKVDIDRELSTDFFGRIRWHTNEIQQYSFLYLLKKLVAKLRSIL